MTIFIQKRTFKVLHAEKQSGLSKSVKMEVIIVRKNQKMFLVTTLAILVASTGAVYGIWLSNMTN